MDDLIARLLETADCLEGTNDIEFNSIGNDNRLAADALTTLQSDKERMREENARLREALRPFVEEAAQYCFEEDCPLSVENGEAWADDAWLADVPTEFKVGDLRRARDAYNA